MSIIHGMSLEDYRALPGLNWSIIKALHGNSPKHVQYILGAPDNDTSSRVMLRAIHCLVLEPDNFDEGFCVYDGVRNRRHKAYQAFLEENEGTSVLNPGGYNAAQRTAEAIRRHPAVELMMRRGSPEVTITWEDTATGLLCKGRADWLSTEMTPCLLDLKTIGTVNEREVSRMAAKGMYHGQLAHYSDGLKANGIDVPAYLVAAEGKGAQDVAVYELDNGMPDGALHVGRHLRLELMAELAECIKHDHWPGRHEDVQSLCLPAYALLDTEITFGEE